MAQELVDLMIKNGWMYESHIPDGIPLEDAHLFSTFTLNVTFD